MRNIVIIGGGHAAAQLCASLTESGQPLAVTLISQEAQLPYHRPPLSKTFIKDANADTQLLRPASAYETAGIHVILNTTATAIDTAARQVHLDSGAVLSYDDLVLATGTRARRLTALEPPPSNVYYLRDAHDARALRQALANATAVSVLGGGFIGLEIAATAAALGKTVDVFEMQARLLARSVSPEVSAYVTANLHDNDIRLHFNTTISDFEQIQGRVTALHCNGQRYPVEILIIGIGATPETSLAHAAGLTVDNGIVVDAELRTSDPNIYAIGDCAVFPNTRAGHTPAARLRLESVQNANDQARTLASVLTHQPALYNALPWFWSDQGTLRLQIAGLVPAESERHQRPGTKPGSFSILHFVAGRLVCVESLNAPMDHLAARKLLDLPEHPSVDILLDPAIPLKTHC